MFLKMLLTSFVLYIKLFSLQVYISETTEPRVRSFLIGAPFFSYSIGILIVFILGSRFHWRTVAWCGNALPLAAAIALFFVHESPVWLLRKERPKNAERALIFLRGNEIAGRKELNTLVRRLDQEKLTPKLNDHFFKLCCGRAAAKPLFIVITFVIFQMFSGTYIVVFYAIDIVAEFRVDFDPKEVAVWSAVIRTICTVVFCILLLFVQRRLMVIISGIGSGLSCLILSVFMYYRLDQPKTEQNLMVASTCIFLYITFNTPLMVMPGIMVGEFFPAKSRGRTGGTIFASCNIALFGLTKTFPLIHTWLKMRGVFMMFAISSFCVSLFMFLMQPETKGRTLEQIEDYFNQRNWFWLTRNKSYERTEENTGV